MMAEGIGNKVRQARKSLLLGQEQVADAAGVSVSTVARLERGGGVSDETLKAVCAVVGLDASSLRRQPDTGQVVPDLVRSEPAPSGPPLAPVAPAASVRRRWPRMVGMACLYLVAALPLSLVGIDIGVQGAIRASEPDRLATIDLARAISVRMLANELNKATVAYSTTVSKDDPDREWEPWKQKPVRVPVCGRKMPGVYTSIMAGDLTDLFKIPFTVLVINYAYHLIGDEVCQEEGVPSLVLRRDERVTEFLTGPMPAKSGKALLGLLTADPSVSVEAVATQSPDPQAAVPGWADPRRSSVDPVENGYVRIRFGRAS